MLTASVMCQEMAMSPLNGVKLPPSDNNVTCIDIEAVNACPTSCISLSGGVSY